MRWTGLAYLLVTACSATVASRTDLDGGSASGSSSSASASASHASGTIDNGAGDGGCACDAATQYEYDDGTHPPTCLELPAACIGATEPCHTCVPRPSGPSAPAATDCLQTVACGIVLTPLGSGPDR